MWFKLQIDPGLIEQSAWLRLGWSPRTGRGWTLVRGGCWRINRRVGSMSLCIQEECNYE